MDEGMNSYYDKKYSQAIYPNQNPLAGFNSSFLLNRIPEDFEEILLSAIIKQRMTNPFKLHRRISQTSIIIWWLI
jgi:hypothetical protein